MLRSIGAVLAGYASIGILVVLTGQIVEALNPAAFTVGKVPPTYYFVLSLFTVPLYSVVGGYICGRLAAVNPWKHGIALAIFGELMGLASMAAFWGKQPLWYGLALLVLYPPAVLLGARLSLRRGTLRAASAG